MKFNIKWISKSYNRETGKVKLRWYVYVILAILWIALAYLSY